MKKIILAVSLLVIIDTMAVAQVANTSTGIHALFNNTGSYNTADGQEALYSNTTGYSNVAVGVNALQANTQGGGNIGIGINAMATNTLGISNTAVGSSADVGSNNLYNATAIGSNARVDCNNCLVLGSVNGVNGGTSSIRTGIGITSPKTDLHIKQSDETYPLNGGGLRLERKLTTNHWDIGTDNGNDLDFNYNGVAKTYLNEGSGTFTIVSDLRMKKDIQLVGTTLPSIMQLQAKTYRYKDNNDDATLSYGFIAQEVEKLFPAFVTTKGTDNMKGIIYQNFDVLAIKGIQEQQTIIEGQQKEIDQLKEQNKLILQEIEKIKRGQSLCL